MAVGVIFFLFGTLIVKKYVMPVTFYRSKKVSHRLSNSISECEQMDRFDEAES